MMRLEKIKLSGFKSFVDPTTLELRSPLVAVVGPNGCGKSNIIDAIRWVMGESSAKNLRGESMADVIFNGSATRKPVGQASIELVFDNSDGSLGGEYARFNQISVRRLGTRDGQSSYFLNGTRCRRKDITDIFLGTGLGPRSYAIIEQGMISRVIEAKPEELRSFLEEAAGISLYRKRRQETETRMRHTRENLDRLSDLRQELDKQLERLKRQSEGAERYKTYKAEHDRLEAELSALRWQVLNEQIQERAGSIRRLATALEEKMASRTSLDLEIEKQRLDHTEKMDAWKIEQGQYYDLGTQIARVEQSLQHHREREDNLRGDLQQIKESYQQASSQIAADEQRLCDLEAEWVTLEPDHAAADTQLKQAAKVLSDAEEAMRQWNHSFEQFQQMAEKPQRTAEVEKARIEQLERQTREAGMRLERLQNERSEINTSQLEDELEVLNTELLSRESTAQHSLAEYNELSSCLNQEREILKSHTNELDQVRGQLQSSKGRFASLEALQQAALGKTNSTVKHWLEAHQLQQYPRLGELLTVDKGYERAVETVLGNSLEAICVPGIDPLTAFIDEIEQGDLTFIEQTGNGVTPLGSLELLQSKIKTDCPIQGLLAGVYCVDDLSEALAKRRLLSAGESIVTRAGIWIGSNWLKVYRGTEGHAGVLAREAELKELGQKIAALTEQSETIAATLVSQQEKIAALEQERDALQRVQQDQFRLLNEVTSKISALRARLEHHRNRLARLESDRLEHQQKLELAEEEISLARLSLEQSINEMDEFAKKRMALQAERETMRSLLHRATQEAAEARERAHGLALKEQSIRTQRQAIQEALGRLSHHRQSIAERSTSLEAQLEGLKGPEAEMRQALEELLGQQVIAEKALDRSRAALDELEQTLRSLEKQRQVLEQESQDIRSQLEQARLEWQTIEVRIQTLLEKLTEMGQKVEDLVQNLPPEATEAAWAQELEQVTKRIERLGAINLAAIEEYQTESERKHYLDAQNQDLMEALETLEAAIRKIDKETRTRFKDTFEKVNSEFQTLFPRLFGGGQAYLELTGEDLLEAGVSVMARPPGKRNSSIHLLSGGEKALTAVAMVFAIFQLNPAPFCLLDEVDAPLDDANVGRFCDLVKQLSNTVQFIFVTHNKLAMEMAHHLVGVTMKEAGVSRLVSVDVEEAAALVAE